jgi:ketosteroid isomerase-like protein
MTPQPNTPSPTAPERPGASTNAPSAREATVEMLTARSTGESPADLAERFSEDVDWFIGGDVDNIPWLGRKVGRAGVIEHFTQLGDGVQPESFELDTIVSEGDRAVVLGEFRARFPATGAVVDSWLVFDVTTDANGLITRYRVFEDTFAISRAARSSV